MHIDMPLTQAALEGSGGPGPSVMCIALLCAPGQTMCPYSHRPTPRHASGLATIICVRLLRQRLGFSGHHPKWLEHPAHLWWLPSAQPPAHMHAAPVLRK